MCFFFFFFNLRLCWVIVALCKLFLVAASGGYSSCGAWASLCSGFSSCGTWALGYVGFSGCGSKALEQRLSTCGAPA